MGLRNDSSIRSYVPEEQRMLNLLETDTPLPDDDPKTRRGGLDPSRQKDLGQIEMYAKLIQAGQVSDKAKSRLIQRNPRSATLFSSIGVDPSVKDRREIGKKYFHPGQEAVPFETDEEQFMGVKPLTGNVEQEEIAPKGDFRSAYLAAHRAGNTDLAKEYLTGMQALNPGETPDAIDKRNRLSFDQANKLRDEHQKLSKSFIDVRDSYGRIQESAKDPSAAGDLALIFNYMKMLDPGSTVREGEFATAQNAAGVPERVVSMYNRAMSGERLADNTRSDFLKRSGSLYKRQLTSQRDLDKTYKALANRLKVDPDLVITRFELTDMPVEQQPKSQAPKVLDFSQLPKRR